MPKRSITAIILAGGKSTRMGGIDKGLILFKGKPLYQHVIDRIQMQVDEIMINCNRNHEQYALSGYKTFSDNIKGYLGPLSGIYSGLLHSQTDWNLVVSCDTPFLPYNLVDRLFQQSANHFAIYPFDGKYTHPTILLINVNQVKKINAYLAQGDRKLMFFLKSINAAQVDFSDQSRAFININTPENLSDWENYAE